MPVIKLTSVLVPSAVPCVAGTGGAWMLCMTPVLMVGRIPSTGAGLYGTGPCGACMLGASCPGGSAFKGAWPGAGAGVTRRFLLGDAFAGSDATSCLTNSGALPAGTVAVELTEWVEGAWVGSWLPRWSLLDLAWGCDASLSCSSWA